MKISVIITTFNGELFIQEQINSILNQSRQADEIIIGDDSSSDMTIQIINDTLDYGDYSGKVDVVVRKTNIGLYSNIKDLIRRCSGDIIVFSDQDDVWLSNKLFVIEDIFINNPEIRALLTGFKAIDSNDHLLIPGEKDDNIWITDNIRNSEISKIDAADELCRNFGPGCSLAVKRKVAEEFLLSKSQLIHDWQLCLIASIEGGLYYTPIILTYYRQHDSNTIGMSVNSNKDLGICRKLLLIPIYIKYCFSQNSDSLRSFISYSCFSPEMVSYYLRTFHVCDSEKQDAELYYKYSRDYWSSVNGHKIIKWFITIRKYKQFRKKRLFVVTYENHIRLLLSEIAVILRHL